MMPIPESVALPFVDKQMNADGRFEPGEAPESAGVAMLDELQRWAVALAPLRA